jgi:diacylglycerol kinase family enzyme
MTEKRGFPTKVSCIINLRAAKNKWLRKRKKRSYLQKKLPGQVYDVLGEKENTVELARKLSQNSEMIVAVGGDGTVADVMQGIIEAQKAKEVLLGIVPFGSGNAFRKSLSIPKKTEKAIEILMKGEAKEIDLIQVEDRVAGFASVGATAGITLEKLRHNIQGFWGHVLAARKLFSMPIDEKEIELFEGREDDGTTFAHKKLKLRFLDCVVAKTNYFGYSWTIAPKAKVDDNFLDITFFELSRLKSILFFPLIYFGIFQRTQKHFKAKKIIISGRNLPVQYNGEVLGVRDKIELKVLPRAMKIICPKE